MWNKLATFAIKQAVNHLFVFLVFNHLAL